MTDVQNVTVTDGTSLSINGIAPGTMNVGTTVLHTITGDGFAEGATVTFSNGSGPAPVTLSVEVPNAQTIFVEVSIKNGGPRGDRVWDVTVTNPGGDSVVAPGGLTITR
ncbi:MAG: hypothetical protein HN420_15095 [Rhodospirillaceae bacterium]|nr:hypothetical protein [Rhodospirillaceae bacterium]